jgi:hypothetical protein
VSYISSRQVEWNFHFWTLSERKETVTLPGWALDSDESTRADHAPGSGATGIQDRVQQTHDREDSSSTAGTFSALVVHIPVDHESHFVEQWGTRAVRRITSDF